MHVNNSLMTRCAGFIFPWSSDLEAGTRRSEDFIADYKNASKRFSSSFDDESIQIPINSYDYYASPYVKGARCFKLVVGIICLITAAILLYQGIQTSNTTLFYAGVGGLIFSAAWFSCLTLRNQTTGRGLPSCLPYIGGWRLINR